MILLRPGLIQIYVRDPAGEWDALAVEVDDLLALPAHHSRGDEPCEHADHAGFRHAALLLHCALPRHAIEQSMPVLQIVRPTDDAGETEKESEAIAQIVSSPRAEINDCSQCEVLPFGRRDRGHVMMT